MKKIFGLIIAIGSITLGSASADAAPAPESFAPLVEKLTPAVVNVSTTQKIAAGPQGIPGMPFMFQLPDDPQFAPFRDFFEQFGQGMQGQQQEQEVYSLGSGFIIDPSGYVVTNNHVIADAEKITVILQDNTKLEAKIVGRDSKTDLALLKVESKKPLPSVHFGDSDAVKVGDWVIAIGNPFGLGGSVSAGIISARSRSINAGPFDDFLQTDAAINRGNSGGPMFNMAGEVIGINTAIISPTGGNIGIGFAVPALQAQPVIEQLKTEGRIHRAWLGVKIQEVTDEIAESVGLDATKGALVLGITSASPAAKSDIKAGDIILSFDGKDISEMRKLPRIVAETKIGKKVDVKLWRGGEIKHATVTLGEMDESDEDAASKNQSKPKKKPNGVDSEEMLGMDLAAIDSGLINRFGLDKNAAGLLVLQVKAGSAASKQGIRYGDVITRVNTTLIKTLGDFKTALGQAKKSGRGYALVRVKRNEEEIFVTLPTALD